MKKRKSIILLIATLLMIILLSSFNIVKAEIKGDQRATIDNPDSIIDAANDWTNTQGGQMDIDQKKVDTTVNSVYRILLTIGIIISLIWGAVLGIKFLFGSMEDRVDIKKHLLPYVIWVCVIFGSFIIWSVVVGIMQKNF